MSEEEKNEETPETPAGGAGASDEGSDASAAGPVAGEDSSSSQAAGDEPTPAPPAEEASEPEADAEAPEPEAAGQDAGDAEVPAGDSDGDDFPWKERRRLERSRVPHEAKAQRSAEERAGERGEARRAGATARRRYREAQRSKKGEPGAGTPPADRKPNPAKTRQGVVVSDRADKTITVRIDIARRHPTYEKVVRRSRTLRAHDERNEAGEGDIVRVIETRPLSRTKRWRLVEVVEKAR
jgi:small subunit ribosomal protein S17